jgi:hypothetical protein
MKPAPGNALSALLPNRVGFHSQSELDWNSEPLPTFQVSIGFQALWNCETYGERRR